MSENIQSSIDKIIPETEQISEIITEQIRFRGQRGADKRPRRINANSLRNLRQYRNIPVAKPNSDIWLWIVLVIAVALVIGLLIWKLYQNRKKDSED